MKNRLTLIGPDRASLWTPPCQCHRTSRGYADIGDHKLNGAGGKELPDIIMGERFPTCGGREHVTSPQFAERQVSHDPEIGVHDADDCSSRVRGQLA